MVGMTTHLYSKSGLILDIYCVSYLNALFELLETTTYSKNVKYTHCFVIFYVKIALNLL